MRFLCVPVTPQNCPCWNQHWRQGEMWGTVVAGSKPPLTQAGKALIWAGNVWAVAVAWCWLKFCSHVFAL